MYMQTHARTQIRAANSKSRVLVQMRACVCGSTHTLSLTHTHKHTHKHTHTHTQTHTHTHVRAATGKCVCKERGREMTKCDRERDDKMLSAASCCGSLSIEHDLHFAAEQGAIPVALCF
jgi:hypothetical protein